MDKWFTRSIRTVSDVIDSDLSVTIHHDNFSWRISGREYMSDTGISCDPDIAFFGSVYDRLDREMVSSVSEK